MLTALAFTSLGALIGTGFWIYFLVRYFPRKLRVAKSEIITSIQESAPQFLEQVAPKLSEEIIPKLIADMPNILTKAFTSDEFQSSVETAIKRVEGAMYKKMGIDNATLDEGIAKIKDMFSGADPAAISDMVEVSPSMALISNAIEDMMEDSDQSPWVKMAVAVILQKIMPMLMNKTGDIVQKKLPHMRGY